MKNYDFVTETALVDVSKIKVKAFDKEAAIATINDIFEGELNRMHKIAEAFEVKDQETLSTAVEMINQAKKLDNHCEKVRKHLKKDTNEYNTVVDTGIRNIKNPLAEIIAILKKKSAPIALKIKEEEERRLQKEREAREKAEAAAAKKKSVVAPTIPSVPSSVSGAAAGRFDTSEGSAKVSVSIKWSVVDLSAVPRKFKVTTINEKALDEAIQAGAQVPGVRTWKDVDLQTRVKRG